MSGDVQVKGIVPRFDDWKRGGTTSKTRNEVQLAKVTFVDRSQSHHSIGLYCNCVSFMSRQPLQQSEEDASKWTKVRVNDEYYMLDESISDSSSGDESEEEQKKDKKAEEDTSIASSGLTREGALGSRSRSSTISEANTPIGTPIVATTAAGAVSRSTGIARAPIRTVTQPAVRIAIKSESKPASSSVPVRAAVQVSGVAPLRSIPARETEYVSLRDRNNSSSSTATDRSNAVRLRSNSLSKETPEKWRMRIWPSKALTAFTRIITRCSPPDSIRGYNLGNSGSTSHNSSHRGKPEKAELKPHWRMSELAKVPNRFDDAAVHSSAFFLLTVEECREAVSHAEDPEAFGNNGDNKANRSQDNRSDGWINGEITAIVAESAFAPLPKACDPRLGSVWVIAAAISPQSGGNNSGGPGKSGMGKYGSGCDVSGGDLMVLRSPQWSHPLLGIIQPWDPDYDIKYGINFSVNQSTYITTQPSRDNKGVAPLQVVNILVCVDQSDGLGAQDIGGWASQGSIVPGVGFSMTSIGNVMTYIRECQALMSLKLINKSLQNMVLTGSFSPNYTAALRAATGTSTTQVVSTTGSSAESSSSSSSDDDSDGDAPTPVKSKNAARQVLSPRRALLEQPINCPENVPMPLWLALRRQYNESQLRAICMVSRRFQEKEYHTGQSTIEASLSLLQGPPGTGKTRTILGIVSVFLAGALNLTAQGTTRIVAGASLYGETAGEASTKWSDEKLQRPRGGSISLNTTNADGQPVGKRTRVLICAPSNTAVDEVVYRLITQGVLDSQGKRMSDLSVIRIGQPNRDEYSRTGMDTFGNNRTNKPGISSNDENMVRTVERYTLDTLVEERRRTLMASDTRATTGAAFKLADIRKQILDGADVVCSTLSGAGSQPMLEVVLRITGFKFDAVIIDEAAQAVEPSSLIPFKYNPQAVVLVGDPCQLPATVFSNTAKRAGYSQSLFQRLQVAGYPVLMLETQYRMHPAIAEYPSLRYYQSRLITGSALITSDSHKMPYHDDVSGKFKPFLFHNVPYSVETTEGTSTSNRDEARYVVDLFEELVTKYPDHRGGIGIIAPYRAQRRLLNTLFRERFAHQYRNSSGRAPIFDLDTEISTVDGFQGREKNIVIFSCVRAPTNRNHYYNSRKETPEAVSTAIEGENEVVVAGRVDADAEQRSTTGPASRGIGFLKEWQRLNVAITRSRYALWIVGNSDVLSGDSEWRHLVEYSKNKNSFYTAPCPADLNSSNNSRGPYHNNNHNNSSHYNNHSSHNNSKFSNQRGNQHSAHDKHGKYKHPGNKPPPPPPPPRPPLPPTSHNSTSAAVNAVPGVTAVAISSAPVSISGAQPSADTRPPKRPPAPACSADSADKKARSDAVDTSLSSTKHGPFSFANSKLAQQNSQQHAPQTHEGPFSFKIEAPSGEFDKHERNLAALQTYLPPSQAAQHPLSPQQRRDQHQLGLDSRSHA